MARILAIDYGTKRAGIAVTDPEKIIATGLSTVNSPDILAFLENYLKNNEVECFVVGEPKRLNNLPSDSAKSTNEFVTRLKNRFKNIPVKRMDERFTSKIAQHSLLQSGLKKSERQNKELVDMVSAILILQSYLELENNKQ